MRGENEGNDWNVNIKDGKPNRKDSTRFGISINIKMYLNSMGSSPNSLQSWKFQVLQGCYACPDWKEEG